MTAPEVASAARTPPEFVSELRPALPLADALEGLLVPAGALRRDVRVRAAALTVADGLVTVDGRRFALRPLAARQLRALVSVAARSPSVILRRALLARGERSLLLRLDGNEVRAVLGCAFVPIDDVFERVTAAIKAMGWRRDLVVRLFAITEAATVVRLTLRRSRVELREGDVFERGVEIASGETGLHALTFTPFVWRAGCFNFSLAPQPTLRIVHHRLGAHEFRRDLRKDLAHALDAARPMMEAWRSSSRFDEANDITSTAKQRSLAARIAEERHGQRVVEGPPVR